jgi:hypothetical protein
LLLRILLRTLVADHVLFLLLDPFSLPLFLHQLLLVLSFFDHTPCFAFLLLSSDLSDYLVDGFGLSVWREPLYFTSGRLVNQIVVFSDVLFESAVFHVGLLDEGIVLVGKHFEVVLEHFFGEAL